MYKEGGSILAFDPVLRELNSIEPLFDKIIWLGARRQHKKPSLKPVNNPKIITDVMPCVSRNGLINVLFVLLAYPVFFFKILKYLPQATHVQTRGPSHPALLGILVSLLDNKRIYAHKYAGEWTQSHIPFTYNLQRSILKSITKQNVRITVSGKNDTDRDNVYDIQNPCIYDDELSEMNRIAKEKDFSGSLKLLFAGNLMPTKGIIELLEALEAGSISGRYTKLYVAGGGNLMDSVKEKVGRINKLEVIVTGSLSREDLNKLYAEAHVLILPSISESFPKVIAEAAAYGCIPVTTSLSAIVKQITDGENGFLMDGNTSGEIRETLNKVAASTELQSVSQCATGMSNLYTYSRFKERMKEVYNIADDGI